MVRRSHTFTEGWFSYICRLVGFLVLSLVALVVVMMVITRIVRLAQAAVAPQSHTTPHIIKNAHIEAIGKVLTCVSGPPPLLVGNFQIQTHTVQHDKNWSTNRDTWRLNRDELHRILGEEP